METVREEGSVPGKLCETFCYARHDVLTHPQDCHYGDSAHVVARVLSLPVRQSVPCCRRNPPNLSWLLFRSLSMWLEEVAYCCYCSACFKADIAIGEIE